MKEFLTNLLNMLGLAWWVEVITENPRCTYYFGPFMNEKDAQASRTGYVEDLEHEGAQGIIVSVKRCKPASLTISEDASEGRSKVGVIRALSSQF